LPQSPSLYRALAHQRERFDLIVFAPYLRSTTYLGAMAVVDKAVMWPCLHDEAYAYFHPTRVVLACARGVAYNTETERELAHRLGARNPAEHVIGAGVELDVRPNLGVKLPVAGPYVMYAGRMEGAKNYGLLAEYFIRFKARHPGELKLVVSGTGQQEDIRHPDIVHLGFLPRADMLGIMRGATVFCQPSVNESFSYVIMEAWLAGAPVLVHRHCAVTVEHVDKSQGGLAFADYAEFEAALGRLVQHPDLRQGMAHAGQAYVRRQYNWDAVLARLEAAFQTWRATPPEPDNH
jgi:glycosyltransferase involved in cell wall biosynthesis